MARLSDYDLTVLVEEGAKAAWDNGDSDTPWEDLGPMKQNSTREQVLPVIYKATMKLEELGWVKRRKFYAVKELESLVQEGFFRDVMGTMWSLRRSDSGKMHFYLTDATSLSKEPSEMENYLPLTEV